MKLQTIQKDGKLYGELPKISSELEDVNSYFSTIDINQVVKYGKIVEVNFRGQLSKEIPSSTDFLKTPFGKSSAVTGTFGFGEHYSIENVKWFYFGNKQYFRTSKIDGVGKWIHISFVYIAD